MRSNARSETLDLARDLPTTAEDTDALRRAGAVRLPDLETYLRFLAQFPPCTHEWLRRKRGPRADRPLTLD